MTRILVTMGVVLGISGSALCQEKFLGKTVEVWTAQLKTAKDAKQRRSAAFALGKMGQAAFVSLADLRQVLVQEKEPRVREAIVSALGDICRDTRGLEGDADLRKVLLASLRDEEPLVRRSAAYALGCLGSAEEDVRAALDAALADKSPLVRQNAVRAVGQIFKAVKEKDLPAILPSFRKGLQDEDLLVKRDAAGALLPHTDSSSKEKIHELVNDLHPLCKVDHPEVRRAALAVLVRIVEPKDRAAIASIRMALDDRDVENRRNAALALSNIGGDDTAVALPVLREAIKNGDVEMRRQAVLAVRNIGPGAAPAVEEMMRLLRSDPDDTVRRNAALALGGIEKASEPAIPLLVDKLVDAKEDVGVRTECAMTLARLGPVPGAYPIVPRLLKFLSDPSQEIAVRERTIWSLSVHNLSLRKMEGTHDAFLRVIKEDPIPPKTMLRYHSAYMLGMIWDKSAPEPTLDVFTEFLKNDGIKLFEKTVSDVTGQGAETKSGQGTVAERGFGDGRMMAVEALEKIGALRYRQRPEIMKQLMVLANDAMAYPPLRMKAAELIKAAK